MVGWFGQESEENVSYVCERMWDSEENEEIVRTVLRSGFRFENFVEKTSNKIIKFKDLGGKSFKLLWTIYWQINLRIKNYDAIFRR